MPARSAGFCRPHRWMALSWARNERTEMALSRPLVRSCNPCRELLPGPAPVRSPGEEQELLGVLAGEQCPRGVEVGDAGHLVDAFAALGLPSRTVAAGPTCGAQVAAAMSGELGTDGVVSDDADLGDLHGSRSAAGAGSARYPVGSWSGEQSRRSHRPTIL